MFFNLQKSASFKAYQRYHSWQSYLSAFFKVITAFWIFLSIVGILAVLALVPLEIWLEGMVLIFWGILALVFFYLLYYRTVLMQYCPPLPLAAPAENVNLADFLDGREVVGIVKAAYELAQTAGHGTLEPVHLLVSLPKDPVGRYVFVRAGIAFSGQAKAEIDKALANIPLANGIVEPKPSEHFLAMLQYAGKLAAYFNEAAITDADLILALSSDSVFKKILFDLELEFEDLVNIVNWYRHLKELTVKKPFWQTQKGGIGRDFSYGYTPTLLRLSQDLTEQVELGIEIRTYGRRREIDELERALAKSAQANALLVGEHGVGKKTMVLGLIRRIVKGKCIPSLRYKRVLALNTGAILAGASQKGEVEARLQTILSEAARAGNVILFIEDFHSLVSAKEHTGAVNAAEILLPYLQGSALQVVGTTTYENLHQDIEANSGVANTLAKIEVPEPKPEDVIKILEDSVPELEIKNGVIFSYHALKEAIAAAGRYLHDEPFPEKAIELCDAVAVEVAKKGGPAQRGGRMVTKDDVDAVVSQKAQVPVGQVEAGEKEKLLHLEEFLHRRIVDQEEAVKVVSDAMRRARSGLQKTDKPIGVFLFLGPTGVGKTETSKALAEAYFGSEKNMIRFDMSEFQEPQAVYRLIGSPPSAGQAGSQGELTSKVKDQPFSLLLFDEIEKAQNQVLNLFLQLFDEGRLTDGTGRTIDFTNTIIIVTSNAGSELIRERLQMSGGRLDAEAMKKELLEHLQQKGIFRPEFLNRFDAIVAFKPLGLAELRQIVGLMVVGIQSSLQQKGITLELTSAATDKLAQVGFDPQFGARPLRRAIQEKVENQIAERLLSGTLNRGDKIVLDEKDII